MTQEKYRALNGLDKPGKHEKQWYKVWRVLTSIGPVETLDVYGRQEAYKAVENCWDYEIVNSKGEIIK